VENEQEIKDSEGQANEPMQIVEEKVVALDGEFKLTVRKLEMPVRPRGVLAE